MNNNNKMGMYNNNKISMNNSNKMGMNNNNKMGMNNNNKISMNNSNKMGMLNNNKISMNNSNKINMNNSNKMGMHNNNKINMNSNNRMGMNNSSNLQNNIQKLIININRNNNNIKAFPPRKKIVKKIKKRLRGTSARNRSKNNSFSGIPISSNNMRPKHPNDKLVNELLCRWWYALPPWPPENYDISQKLIKNNLRLINSQDWKKEPKFDENGLEKCIELPGYKYVMLTSEGKTFDFRPEEGKPTYNNFIKMPRKKILGLLMKALEKQMSELNKRQKVVEVNLRKQVRNKLIKVQNMYKNLG